MAKRPEHKPAAPPSPQRWIRLVPGKERTPFRKVEAFVRGIHGMPEPAVGAIAAMLVLRVPPDSAQHPRAQEHDPELAALRSLRNAAQDVLAALRVNRDVPNLTDPNAQVAHLRGTDKMLAARLLQCLALVEGRVNVSATSWWVVTPRKATADEDEPVVVTPPDAFTGIARSHPQLTPYECVLAEGVAMLRGPRSPRRAPRAPGEMRMIAEIVRLLGLGVADPYTVGNARSAHGVLSARRPDAVAELSDGKALLQKYRGIADAMRRQKAFLATQILASPETPA